MFAKVSKNRISLAGCACAALALFSPASHARNVLANAPGVGVDYSHPSSGGPSASQSNVNAPHVGNVQGESPQAKGGKLKKLASALSLTPQQKAFLKPVIRQSHLQILEIGKNRALSPRQKHAGISQIRRYTLQQIKSILTPIQQSELNEMMAEAKERRG